MACGYVSPVALHQRQIPENWLLLYSLNPMVGVIDGFRWALLGGESRYVAGFSDLCASDLRPLSVRALVFPPRERAFADVI